MPTRSDKLYNEGISNVKDTNELYKLFDSAPPPPFMHFIPTNTLKPNNYITEPVEELKEE